MQNVRTMMNEKGEVRKREMKEGNEK